MHLYTHTHTYTYIHTPVCTYTHLRVHTHTYTCVPTPTYVYSRIPRTHPSLRPLTSKVPTTTDVVRLPLLIRVEENERTVGDSGSQPGTHGTAGLRTLSGVERENPSARPLPSVLMCLFGCCATVSYYVPLFFYLTPDTTRRTGKEEGGEETKTLTSYLTFHSILSFPHYFVKPHHPLPRPFWVYDCEGPEQSNRGFCEGTLLPVLRVQNGDSRPPGARMVRLDGRNRAGLRFP